jgi:predicted DNA-binding antitoxin AbrB/MazE fold protein
MREIRVRYEDGVFKPLQRTDSIEEGAEGEVRLTRDNGRPSLRSSKFFGLWKDRKDMKDGATYVRKLRSEARY